MFDSFKKTLKYNILISVNNLKNRGSIFFISRENRENLGGRLKYEPIISVLVIF